MSDHAIVLYDPTIDDRPDPAELEALKLEEQKKKQEEEARGPHKSLKSILGIVDVKKKADVKVPVVIDPRLSKMLRPHQIEGVKVSLAYLVYRHLTLTAVSVSMYNGIARQQRMGVYHGGRDGSR